MSEVTEIKEGRWEGVREVMAMSWPIILGSLSYTVMDFSDKFMAGWLGTAALAAAPAAALWSFTLSTMFLGALGCVSTFVAQSLGREDYENCGRYAWQGLYLAVVAGAATVLFWPVSTIIFSHTQMSAEAQQLAEGFFQIRLLGYIAMAWCTVLAAFFQAVSRPFLPMWASLFCCVENVVLGYILMFGKFGLPEMGVNGLALGTVLSQYTQMAILTYWFLTGEIAAKYRTRQAWAFQSKRMLDVLRIGIPGGPYLPLRHPELGPFHDAHRGARRHDRARGAQCGAGVDAPGDHAGICPEPRDRGDRGPVDRAGPPRHCNEACLCRHLDCGGVHGDAGRL
jgi:MATE family multidrug resistance protein